MDREPWRPLLLLPSYLGGGDGGEIHCYFKACARPGASVARVLDLCRIQPSACTWPLKFTAGLRPEGLKGSREKAETHLSPHSLPRGPLPGSLLAERDLQPHDNGSTNGCMPALPLSHQGGARGTCNDLCLLCQYLCASGMQH